MWKFKLEEYARKQIQIVLCLYVGCIMTGYTAAWTAPVVPKLQDIEQTPLPDVISLTQASWIASMSNVGNMIGPLLAAPLSNVIGRKSCILIGAIIDLLAQFVLLFAVNLGMLFTGKFLSGFGTSFTGVLIIVYLGEIATPSIRGALMTASGFFIVMGSLFMYIVGPLVTYQVTVYVAILLCFVQTLALCLIPESPLYHMLKGNEEAARKTLTYLGRAKDIEKTLTMIAENKMAKKEKNPIWKELFIYKSNRKSLLIAIGLNTFQLCSGTMAVSYLLITIFEIAGSSVKPEKAAIIIGVTQLVCSVFVPAIVDRVGRKILLLVSTAGCSCCMTVMGIYFYLDKIEHSTVESLGWVPLVTLLLSYVSVSVGINVVPSILIGEMFRPNVRSLGAMVSMTFGSLMGALSTSSFGYFIEFVGNDFTFWMFAVINALGFLFSLFIVPETKGLTLQEVEKMLAK